MDIETELLKLLGLVEKHWPELGVTDHDYQFPGFSESLGLEVILNHAIDIALNKGFNPIDSHSKESITDITVE